MLFFIYQRHKLIKLLKHDNTMLDYGKQDAERTLTDLKELSTYESMTELPLTAHVKVNKLCDHLTELTQKHCNKGVTTIFQTDFPDDFEIITNYIALEKVISRLLRCSYKFMQQGLIVLKCVDSSDNIKFCVSYTNLTLNNKQADYKTEKLAEQDSMNNFMSMNISICQTICRLILGNIWMEKDRKNGTRFYFEIPKQPITDNKKP